MWPKTEKQSELLATAERLAAEFAPRAAAHDREASFPSENFEALRASGYLAAAIPTEYGGPGHGLDDVVLAHLALAQGDGSTALGAGMHLMVCGTEADARVWPEAVRARLFEAVLRDGAILNNIAAEPDLGSPQGGGRPATTLTPTGAGRWRLDGRKTFSTLAPVLTHFVTYAAVDDGSGDVARVAVPRERSGMRIEETWDALGMRASGSHDVLFEGVEVLDEDFTTRTHPGQSERGVPAWFALTVGATNLGIAEAALEYTVRFARERRPSGGPHVASIPHVREQVGRMEALSMAARALLLQTAEDWAQHPDSRSDLGAAVAASKRLATNSAVEIVELAMRVVGGVALHRSEPLERYFRDVRAGLVNPPIEARALETIAASLLDVLRE
ncbi:MAG: acyl-CoA dehydrogenase family protein [Dehalococcoidia bacterium]